MEPHEDTTCTQHAPTDLVCTLCCKRFITSVNFAKHVSHCRNQKEIRFRCHTCNKGFKQRYRFDNHRCTNCNVCRKSFHSSGALREHFEATHNGTNNVKRYICDQCGREFTFKATIARHLMSIHFRSGTMTRCFFCPKSFLNGLAMKIHMRKHKNLATCDICSEKINLRSIHLHRRLAHGIERTYDCAHCSMRYAKRSRLRYHMKTVHGEASLESDDPPQKDLIGKFGCKLCCVHYNSLQSLKIHMRFMHDEPRLRELKCNKCDYTTFIKGHMRDHHLAHANNWFIA